jgi:hypothetical protein
MASGEYAIETDRAKARETYERIVGAACIALASIEDRTIEIRNEVIDPRLGYDREAWWSVRRDYAGSQGLGPRELKMASELCHDIAECEREDFELSLTSTGE